MHTTPLRRGPAHTVVTIWGSLSALQIVLYARSSRTPIRVSLKGIDTKSKIYI